MIDKLMEWMPFILCALVMAIFYLGIERACAGNVC